MNSMSLSWFTLRCVYYSELVPVNLLSSLPSSAGDGITGGYLGDLIQALLTQACRLLLCEGTVCPGQAHLYKETKYCCDILSNLLHILFNIIT